MNKLISLLRLIRAPNLLMMAFGLSLFQYFIIVPNLALVGIPPTLGIGPFILFCLAVCCIAAAGNVINDFFDQEADQQFKKRPVVVGNDFTPDQAYTLYFVLNVSGILLGFLLSFMIDNHKLAYFFVLPALLLWFYSYSLKKLPLIGNVLIAFLTAFQFLLLVLMENNLFMSFYFPPALEQVAEIVLLFCKGYMIFAILSSMVREFAKDVEDLEADRWAGMKTLPILLGFKSSKWMFLLLSLCYAAAVGYVQYIYFNGGAANRAWYAMLAIQLPILLSVYFAFKANEPSGFSKSGNMIKISMLGGLGSIPAFYYF